MEELPCALSALMMPTNSSESSEQYRVCYAQTAHFSLLIRYYFFKGGQRC